MKTNPIEIKTNDGQITDIWILNEVSELKLKEVFKNLKSTHTLKISYKGKKMLKLSASLFRNFKCMH